MIARVSVSGENVDHHECKTTAPFIDTTPTGYHHPDYCRHSYLASLRHASR
jgi:hypothetical protein